MTSASPTAHLFSSRPDADFIAGWREHIAATGEPETFDGVSTARAARDVPVILLSEVIAVPVARRPGGDRVPCPLCSPASPKFEKGRMAWFPDDGAARFIGHRCAHRHLGEHYTAAERLFRIEGECARYIAMWPKLQAIRDDLSAIASRIYAKAHRVQSMQKTILVTGKGFASFLHRDLSHRLGVISLSSDEQTYRLAGLTMVRPGFEPLPDAAKAVDLCQDLRKPLPAWCHADGENEALKAILKRGRKAEKVLNGLRALRDDIEDAAKFPTMANMRLLDRWAQSGSSPFERFAIEQDGDAIKITATSFGGVFEPSFCEDRAIIDGLPDASELNALGLAEILN